MTLSALTIVDVLTRAGWPGVSVDTFEELPSTSVWLAELLREADKQNHAAGLSLPVLCATAWQTQGIGRRGKTWQSAPGNITFSLLQELALPPSALMGLSLVTGIAVADVLAPLLPQPVQIKWPNDVLVDGAKLCGLLIELQAGSPGSTRVITGIGVNVHDDPEMRALGIGGIGLSALVDSAALPEHSELLARIAASVLTAYREFEQHGWQAFEARWQALDYLAGRTVTLLQKDGEQQATALGVTGTGALRVTRDGVTWEVVSGDVSVRPQT